MICRDLRRWMDDGVDVVPVSLNFSRLDFGLYSVPEFLEQMRNKYGIPPELLDAEVTESALFESLGLLKEQLALMTDDGHSLWLDDFGSGYSSLNVLKDFSFNVLKIDMIFMREFNRSPKTVPIVTAIVKLAQGLGMKTLCEGVETEEQFAFLSSIGVDMCQGYLMSRPVPKEELAGKFLG